MKQLTFRIGIVHKNPVRIFSLRHFFSLGLIFFSSLPIQAETLKVGEQEIIERVLRDHFQVKIEEINSKIVATGELKAKSVYDTKVAGVGSYNIDQSDESSIVFGTDNRALNLNVEASQRFPLGIDSKLSLNHERFSTNSPFYTDSTLHESTVKLETSVPLLKNRMGLLDKSPIEIAKFNTQSATLQKSFKLQAILVKTLQTYWNLMTAHQYLTWAHEYEKIGKNFLETNLQKKSLGLSEDTDVLAAKASVFERHNEVLTAQSYIQTYQLQLKEQLALSLETKLSVKGSLFNTHAFKPKAEAKRIALMQRPDFLALEKELAAKKIQVVLEKNKKWPSLDLFGSLELNGIDRKLDKTVGETFDFSHPNWLFGMQFSLSAQNRLAKSEAARAELEKAQTLLKLKQLEAQIIQEVEDAYRDLNFRRSQITNFTQVVGLHKQKLNLEMAKFLVGRSSTDWVLRYQNELMQQEKFLLEAWLNYQLGYLKLKLTMGDLIPLEFAGVTDEVLH